MLTLTFLFAVVQPRTVSPCWARWQMGSFVAKAGPEGIHYQFLTKLPEGLLEIFYSKYSIPSDTLDKSLFFWKETIVISKSKSNSYLQTQSITGR